MKKLVLLALFALSLPFLAACGGGSSSNTGSSGGGSSNTVTMGATTFNSNSITIKKGDTITFSTDQSGSPHDLVIGKNGNFTPEAGAPDFGGSNGHMVSPGQSWTTPTWDTPGTYDVSCTIHPTTMSDFVVTVTG